MRHTILVLSVAALMAAIMAMSAFPAFAQGSECGGFLSETARTGQLGQIASKEARNTDFGQDVVAPSCNPTAGKEA